MDNIKFNKYVLICPFCLERFVALSPTNLYEEAIDKKLGEEIDKKAIKMMHDKLREHLVKDHHIKYSYLF